MTPAAPQRIATPDLVTKSVRETPHDEPRK